MMNSVVFTFLIIGLLVFFNAIPKIILAHLNGARLTFSSRFKRHLYYLGNFDLNIHFILEYIYLLILYIFSFIPIFYFLMPEASQNSELFKVITREQIVFFYPFVFLLIREGEGFYTKDIFYTYFKLITAISFSISILITLRLSMYLPEYKYISKYLLIVLSAISSSLLTLGLLVESENKSKYFLINKFEELINSIFKFSIIIMLIYSYSELMYQGFGVSSSVKIISTLGLTLYLIKKLNESLSLSGTKISIIKKLRKRLIISFISIMFICITVFLY